MAPARKPKKVIGSTVENTTSASQNAESFFQRSIRTTKDAIFDPTQAMPLMVMLLISEIVLNMVIIKLVKCKLCFLCSFAVNLIYAVLIIVRIITAINIARIKVKMYF